MDLKGLDHVTIRCRRDQLPAMEQFYGGVLGLEAGKRPNFDAPGFWFYLGGRPVIHVIARRADDAPPPPEGALDHVSFRTSGLEATRERFRARGVAFDEAPVPGFPLHQLFLRDPAGAKVELTFAVPDVG